MAYYPPYPQYPNMYDAAMGEEEVDYSLYVPTGRFSEHRPGEAKVHICNLPFSTSHWQVGAMCAPFGEVLEAFVLKRPHPVNGDRSAIVRFASAEGAEAVIRALDRKPWRGRVLRVRLSKHDETVIARNAAAHSAQQLIEDAATLQTLLELLANTHHGDDTERGDDTDDAAGKQEDSNEVLPVEGKDKDRTTLALAALLALKDLGGDNLEGVVQSLLSGANSNEAGVAPEHDALAYTSHHSNYLGYHDDGSEVWDGDAWGYSEPYYVPTGRFSEHRPGEAKVHICNLPFSTSHWQVGAMCAPFGEVLEAFVLKRPHPVNGDRSAIVRFASAEGAEATIRALDRKPWRGKVLRVRLSKHDPSFKTYQATGIFPPSASVLAPRLPQHPAYQPRGAHHAYGYPPHQIFDASKDVWFEPGPGAEGVGGRDAASSYTPVPSWNDSGEWTQSGSEESLGGSEEGAGLDSDASFGKEQHGNASAAAPLSDAQVHTLLMLIGALRAGGDSRAQVVEGGAGQYH